MGLGDWLFGRKKAPTHEDVRNALFAAAASGDASLAALATQHEATVLEHFDAWKKVPEAVRGDPAAMQAYAQGLIGLARHFASARGNPSLLAKLTGPPQTNPIAKWEQALRDTDVLLDACEFERALPVLRAALDQAKGLTGTAVDTYLPITLGRIGTCLFQSGDAQAALEPYVRALERCEAQGDAEGVAAYRGNLYEVHRYLGDHTTAALVLEAAGAEPRQVARIRAGEPLCRVVVEVNGRLSEVDEVQSAPERARFIFLRNRLTLRRAEVAVDEGIKAGEAGELEQALAAFQRAAATDRFDPWGPYHSGSTLLHLRRYAEAVASFRMTEQLAPGWYHCRADLWLAEQLAAGEVTHATFERIRYLLDGGPTPDQALSTARDAVATRELGLLRLLEGNALAGQGHMSDAVITWRRGLEIAEEPDVKTRLLAALGGAVTEPAERIALLGQAAALKGNLVSAAMASLMLRTFVPSA